jgi:predicted NBD/HSP70 family sugar kinase
MTYAPDRIADAQAARRPEQSDGREQLPEQWSPREKNLASLFTSILTRGPISRRDAARDIGMSQAAVTKLVKPMIAHGYVTEQEGYSEGPGRRLIPLVIEPRRHHAIGVKATERELIGVIVDLHAEVRHSARVALRDLRPEAVVRAVAGLVRDLERGAPDVEGTNVGVGVGLGGHVDGRSGLVRYSPMLGWRDVPLRRMLADELDLPVVIENDVNSLAVAEQWFGAGRESASFAVVTVGSGVGGAIVVDGTLLHGVSGAAGELGHTTINPGGPPCPCGKRGCLETYASDQAILTAVAGSGESAPGSLAEALDLARGGDEAARQAFARAGRALGQGLSGLVNLLNPPLVVLSGEGVSASAMFMDALTEEMARGSFSSAAADCRLVVRPLPDETWARGAAAAMLRQGVLRYLMALTPEIPV